MKKIFFSITIIFTLLIMPIVNSSNVIFAQEKTAREVFNEDYVEYENAYKEMEINEQNVDNFIEFTYNILGDAEAVIDSMSSEDYFNDLDLKGKYRTLLTNFGNLCKIKMDYNYHPENYAHTTNGSIRLNNEYLKCLKVFNNPKNRDEVYNAHLSYFELLNSGELVFNVSKILTSSDLKIKGEISTSDNSLIFSPDDKFIVEKYNSKTLTRNLNASLVDNENCKVENAGVAYYFNLKYYKDGIICDEKLDVLINVKISLVSLSLEDIEDGETIQIAVYENGEVSFIDGVVKNQNVEFSIDKFGTYALIAEGYKPESVNHFLDFVNKNMVLLIIVGCLLLFFILFFKLKRSAKKRRIKREFKEYKAHKKQEERKKHVDENKSKVVKKKRKF